MLCNDVRRVVYFFLDGSLADGKKKDFSSHLNRCPDCEARMQFHMRLRQFLQRRLDRLCLAAPDHLKTRLTRSIRAFRAEWSR
jgi:mycothiol system anti-sigma-R factor